MPHTSAPTALSRPHRLFTLASAAAYAFALAASFTLASCKSASKISAKPASDELHTSLAEPEQTIDPVLAVATFDAAWQLVHDTHFDPTYHGVDWNAVRNELRPEAQISRNESELRDVISDMLGRLGQSHFALIPREIVDHMDDTSAAEPSSDDNENTSMSAAAHNDSAHAGDETKPHTDEHVEPADDDSDREGDLGINVAIIDGESVITRVDHTSPAAKAGIESGWVIDKIDGKTLPSTLLQELKTHLDESTAKMQTHARILSRLRGKPGSSIELSMRDENNKPVDMTLTRRERPGEMIQFGNLPPMNALLEHERLTADDGASVGFIRFNIWMIPLAQPFAVAMDDLRDTEGIVIDLRGNPGGVGGMAMGLAGHFMSETSSLGTMKTRAGEINFTILPRRVDTHGNLIKPFTGPLAILVDQGTASTSEIFAAGLQAIGRARVFGETSAGAALPALMDRLPNGDVLLHAFADFILPTGHSIEGTGVVPDEAVELTRKDLAGGHDPVLAAATKWIASEQAEKPVTAMIAD